MASTTCSSDFKSVVCDNDRVNLRETLLRTLHDQVQEITEKFITLSIYKELPDLSLGAGNDQELVDRTLITLSHLLQLCIIGEQSVGSILPKLDFSKSNVKNIESLSMSLMTMSQPIDSRALLWLRSLVKSKTTQTAIESLLLFISEVGASPQSPKPIDPRVNAVEAGLLLSHQIDLINVVSLIKTAPLKFAVEAALP